jgi:two-component system chemotaxis response regulator CheY
MKHRVLVCDDALFMRKVISDMARSAGYVVVGTATTGVEAVELTATLQPDLVTMDIVMPDLSGVAAVRQICKKDAGARILMCSAMGQEKFVAEALEAGAAGFVVKPFSSEQLISAMKAALAAALPA